MFARNDLLVFADDDERYRLLATFPSSNTAWLIATSAGTHLPFGINLSTLLADGRAGLIQRAPALPQTQVLDKSAAASRKALKDYESIRSLIVYTRGSDQIEQPREDIFHPALRHGLVKEQAERTGVAISTLYARLRRYWIGGQTRDALVVKFQRRGGLSLVRGMREARLLSAEVQAITSLTAGRGAPPQDGRPIYRWTRPVLRNFRKLLLKAVHAKPNVPLIKHFRRYREDHHYFVDGNGERHVRPDGECPSERQMYLAFEQLVPFEKRRRAKVGDKDFEKNERGTTGSAQEDCDGIGHQYEIDATLADIWLRSTLSPSLLAGKPRLVLIVDRKSFLIVGFYVGFEEDSWLSAREAILSIFEDKRALCERYGVRYDPADWPAHGVLPQLFLADRGPLAAKESSIVIGGLKVGIVNLPAERPDWKPYVECSFKLVQQQLVTEDGYEPPNRAKRRTGKKYAQDATMNLHEFTAHILNLIIAHNQRPGTEDHLTADQALRGVQAIPTHLWRDEEAYRIGQLARVEEHVARGSLLRSQPAVVTADGIIVDGAYYTCPTAIREGWFSKARKHRQPIRVRVDRRLCDAIYVELSKQDGFLPLEVATLTGASVEYKGLSIAEMKVIVKARKKLEKDAESIRRDVDFVTRQRNEKLHAPYRNKSRTLTKGMSAAAQVRDVKQTRQADRAAERAQRAAPPTVHLPESAAVLPFPRKPPTGGAVAPDAPREPALINQLHQEMYGDDLPD